MITSSQQCFYDCEIAKENISYAKFPFHSKKCTWKNKRHFNSVPRARHGGGEKRANGKISLAICCCFCSVFAFCYCCCLCMQFSSKVCCKYCHFFHVILLNNRIWMWKTIKQNKSSARQRGKQKKKKLSAISSVNMLVQMLISIVNILKVTISIVHRCNLFLKLHRKHPRC